MPPDQSNFFIRLIFFNENSIAVIQQIGFLWVVFMAFNQLAENLNIIIL